MTGAGTHSRVAHYFVADVAAAAATVIVVAGVCSVFDIYIYIYILPSLVFG